MSDEILEEEMQVLESIYPTELTRISDREAHILVEPEEQLDGAPKLNLLFRIIYPESYPEVLPEIGLDAEEGDLEEDELASLIAELKAKGEENIGMAMTFTLVSHLREELLALVKRRVEKQIAEEKEKERRALEEEEARTRGTPVNPQTFIMWKEIFDKEMARKKATEEEERLKALSSKEREEFKKYAGRLSGKQLFERNRHLDDETNLIEEGSVSVDVSQYDRTERLDEEIEPERVELSDSD